ncbi:MAG TPA: FMN-binding negative transcriptional regulator [Bacillales bacterium]|nr:FMN-binding negative transcriptional regulator [Bacillales bacterium]
MYVPKHFQVDEKEKLDAFIRSNSFGILFSNTESGPEANHLPFLLKDGFLYGHMAKINKQWEGLDGREVLVVFSGPHAYISPTWYEEKDVVPTWNYAAVHVYGAFTPIHEGEELEWILRESVDFYEASMPQPWKVDTGSDYFKRSLKAIVGFKIAVSRVEGKWKLSQNHSSERREKVVRQLEKYEDDHSRQIAKLMKES